MSKIPRLPRTTSQAAAWPLAALMLLLGGCASTLPTGTGGLSDSAALLKSESLDAIGNAKIGDTVSLASGNALGAPSAMVVGEYRAASGRSCREVRLVTQRDVMRVVCERKDGLWTPTRALQGAAMDALPDSIRVAGAKRPAGMVVPLQALGVVTENDTDKPDAIDPDNSHISALGSADGSHTLAYGETLWSFSRRVTGRATNWAAIAKANDIDDAATVKAGTSLSVPNGLVRRIP